MIPPLAIVQARMQSTRLPLKMMQPLDGQPLIWHAWSRAVTAFGADHTVIATPQSDAEAFRAVLAGAQVFGWDGPEWDVLGRFYACAHTYRWHPDSVIVRVTADDPFKDPSMMVRVARGERLPVELGGEAFTLAQLDEAHETVSDQELREHLTWAFFAFDAPKAPEGCVWTVDTQEDLERARRKVGA